MSKTVYRKPGKIEITKGFDFCFKLSQYHETRTLIFSIVYFTFFLSLPNREPKNQDGWDYSWGIYWFESTLNFNWGAFHKCWFAPWSWEHVRHEVLYPEGMKKPTVSWDISDGRIIEVHPYTYKLKNGGKQNVQATIYVEEREWRWKWFTWSPFPKLVQKSININFDGEVGERAGTWKGGTVGCGYDMLKNENMSETLKRMERERVFD